MLDRERMSEPVTRIEDVGDRPFPVPGREDAGGNPFLDDPLDKAPQADPVAPGDGPRGDSGVEMDGEEVRLVRECVPLKGREGDEKPLDFVVGRIRRVGDSGEPGFHIPQPAARHGIEQGVLGGEVAVDVGMRHARFGGHGDDGDTLGPKTGQMLGGDAQKANVGRDGSPCLRGVARFRIVGRLGGGATFDPCQGDL